MSSACRARRRMRRGSPAKSARWAAGPGRTRWTWRTPPRSPPPRSKSWPKPAAVDILVNNAGVTRDGLLMRMSEADWDTVLDTNLKGAFLITKAFSRAFIKQRSGRIINVASVIGLIGNAGQTQLCRQQGGPDRFHQGGRPRTGFARHHRQRAGAGLYRDRHDGRSERGVARRSAQSASRWAASASRKTSPRRRLFLASPAARYITGQVLTVDGGMVM